MPWIRRQPDYELDASLGPIKDSTQDWCDLLGQECLHRHDGFHAKRWVEIQATQEDGTRHYARDKEYAFRPKIAKLVNDSVNYRDFREPPGGPTADAETIPEWVVKAEEVGFEIGLISDYHNNVKSEPDYNPMHYNGPNKSTLVHSQYDLEREDEDRDLPRRYFSRFHDLGTVQPTNEIKTLRRVRFENAPPEGDFFKKDKREETYTDGLYKTMWNITPFDGSPGFQLDQPHEHGGTGRRTTGGEHGFGSHPYSTASSGGTFAGNDTYFMGGWVFDGARGKIAGHISDVIEVAQTGTYLRWRARHGVNVGLCYIRHDAIFARQPRIKGRIHFLAKQTAEDPEGELFWADHYLDPKKAGVDTNVDPPPGFHEDGQWRVIYKLPMEYVPPVDDVPPHFGGWSPPIGETGPDLCIPYEQPHKGTVNDYTTFVFEPGYMSGIGFVGAIPRDNTHNIEMKIKIPVILKEPIGVGEEIKFYIPYFVQGKCPNANHSISHLTVTIDDTHPGLTEGGEGEDQAEHCTVFAIIPKSEFVARPEGIVNYAVIRSGTDTYPNDAHIPKGGTQHSFAGQTTTEGACEG